MAREAESELRSGMALLAADKQKIVELISAANPTSAMKDAARPNPYSTGEWNAIIDATFHPFSRRYPFIIILDGILHGIVEQDPTLSILKFMKYSSPKLLEQILGSDDEKSKGKMPASKHS